jgi:integrase
MPAVKAHFRALPYQELVAALGAIEKSEASDCVKACFWFVALTACRSGEVRGAKWAEIDENAREWRIPASRMKGGEEHRVPLSHQALAFVGVVESQGDGSDFVFPSPRLPGKPLSDMALTKCLKSCGLADRATVHGFRTSFRTWAAERTDADHAVMELCLAHRVGPAVERAYARSDLFNKRRQLMEAWADFLGSELRKRLDAEARSSDGGG